MDIRPAIAGLFRAEGRTDVTKLIVAFRNFAKELKEGKVRKYEKKWLLRKKYTYTFEKKNESLHSKAEV